MEAIVSQNAVRWEWAGTLPLKLRVLDKTWHFGLNKQMGADPSFPYFKPIEITDRPAVADILRRNQPGTSELTFTNLFIWRKHFNFRWCLYNNCLCVTGK